MVQDSIYSSLHRFHNKGSDKRLWSAVIILTVEDYIAACNHLLKLKPMINWSMESMRTHGIKAIEHLNAIDTIENNMSNDWYNQICTYSEVHIDWVKKRILEEKVKIHAIVNSPEIRALKRLVHKQTINAGLIGKKKIQYLEKKHFKTLYIETMKDVYFNPEKANPEFFKEMKKQRWLTVAICGTTNT